MMWIKGTPVKKGKLTLVLHLPSSKRRSKIMITVITFTAYVKNKHLMTLFGQGLQLLLRLSIDFKVLF